jgi:hypothetical protein
MTRPAWTVKRPACVLVHSALSKTLPQARHVVSIRRCAGTPSLTSDPAVAANVTTLLTLGTVSLARQTSTPRSAEPLDQFDAVLYLGTTSGTFVLGRSEMTPAHCADRAYLAEWLRRLELGGGPQPREAAQLKEYCAAK